MNHRGSRLSTKIEPMALSIEEAAVYAGLTYSAIKRLIKQGKLPASKVGSTTLVRRAAIDRMLYDCEMPVGG